MSSYIPKQPKRERDQISIKLDRELLRKLELYGRFLESSRDYIIGAALDLVFRKDKAFAAWLETEGSTRDADDAAALVHRSLGEKQRRPARPSEHGAVSSEKSGA